MLLTFSKTEIDLNPGIKVVIFFMSGPQNRYKAFVASHTCAIGSKATKLQAKMQKNDLGYFKNITCKEEN